MERMHARQEEKQTDCMHGFILYIHRQTDRLYACVHTVYTDNRQTDCIYACILYIQTTDRQTHRQTDTQAVFMGHAYYIDITNTNTNVSSYTYILT